jgi:hypothetical protein
MSILAADYKEQASTDWVRTLSFDEMQKLRAVVRRVHLRYMPASMFSVREADRIIETLGPEVAQRMLKKAVEARL